MKETKNFHNSLTETVESGDQKSVAIVAPPQDFHSMNLLSYKSIYI